MSVTPKTPHNYAVDGIILFESGKVILGRWKVFKRLGAGGCGSVYKVENLKLKGYVAAMKVEAREEKDHGVLKIEANILKQLSKSKNVIRLIESGHRRTYNYMVISLCGYDLLSLKNKTKKGFCEGTLVRKPRQDVLFRGTMRYCSLNMHERKEQTRVDDLWAMFYMLVEVYTGLPWHNKKEQEIALMKRTLSDAVVFEDCPPEFIEMAVYLRTLKYESRPSYFQALPFEQDDTLGRTWSISNGTFTVSGCGSDLGPLNTPDGYLRIFHSCPHRSKNSTSREIQLDILPIFMPHVVNLGSIYLDRHIDDEEK